MKTSKQSAFTLIELLVVISIIAILAAFAVPALSQALVKGQMTGTMNNGRQLYLAGQQMALDGAANSDSNLAWPGDYTGPTVTSLPVYLGKLIQYNYLQLGDVQKLLSAPGATCSATDTVDATTGAVTVVLTGTPALKVYRIQDNNSANTIFAVTNNYAYNTALGVTNPYGSKGFIVQRKGGDASIFKKNQATAALATGGDGVKFKGLVGKLTGDDDSATMGTEAATSFLSNP